MRHSKTTFWSFIFGTAFWVWLDVRLAFFSGVQKCPELRGKWGFHVFNVEIATRSSKSGSSKWPNFISSAAHPHFCVFALFPFTFKCARRIAPFFLPFHFLKTGPFLSFLMIPFLLCNKYLCFSWFCSISLFLSAVLVVLFCFLCFWLSLIIPFFLIFVLFCCSCCLSSCFCYMLSCSCHSSYHPPAYFPPLVFPSLNHLSYSYFILFSFSFACISFDCTCCCGFLSFFLLFLILYFFFSTPCAHLKTKNNGKNNYLILFASGGSLRQCPFTTPCCFLWWDLFLSTNMFVFHLLAICLRE